LLATALSAFLGHGVEAIAITVIVLFAVILGFIQEYRAERAIEALRQMAAPAATVVLGGCERRMPAREVVPGDVIVLATGDKVPADARLIEAVNLQSVEAALTGESAPVEKHIRTLEDEELPTGDRKTMTYAGTAITYGRGRAIVVSTGMGTEFGGIAPDRAGRGSGHALRNAPQKPSPQGRTTLRPDNEQIGGFFFAYAK
jgi:Ca2+-transporting ATPase